MDTSIGWRRRMMMNQGMEKHGQVGEETQHVKPIAPLPTPTRWCERLKSTSGGGMEKLKNGGIGCVFQTCGRG